MYLGVVARDGRLPVLRRVRPRAVATTLVEADDAVVRRVEELPRDVEGRGLGGYQPGVCFGWVVSGSRCDVVVSIDERVEMADTIVS